MDDKDKNTVIDAMEEKKYNRGETVIQQGDAGSELYIVETGHLECTKKFDNEPQEKLLKNFNPGEVFGELALLYNAPRYDLVTAELPLLEPRLSVFSGLWIERHSRT